MNSRILTAMYAVVVIALCIVAPRRANGAEPLQLSTGPHLFIDDVLIASKSGAVRQPITLNREQLSQAPLLTSSNHHTFQPFFTVVRDPNTGLFRLWYGIPTEDLNTTRSRIAYIESSDGITWTNTPRILDVGPIQFGASVIDEGPNFSPREQRYKLGWYFEKGLRIATSPDGIGWSDLTKNVLIEHSHDINGIFWDPIRKRYTAILSFYEASDKWSGKRRITKQSFSTNLLNWSEPTPIITPDSRDEGETQFYAMDGFLARGRLLIGMVKVLRDDLKADNPPQPADAYGIGYTTVAWTHNGADWSRERAPFLDRNTTPNTWDHAHAWIDEQIPVGDEVFLYYAGYKSGHKVNRFQERQIGLIRMKRDRYVGLRADDLGTLRTIPVLLHGKRMFVNANAAAGQIRLQLLTPGGKVIKGFDAEECQPILGDSVHAPVEWKTAELPESPVIIEFIMKAATLFSFELE